MSSQKVVIPKGMINPLEVTVIEIPAELKAVDTVIIKPKLMSNIAIHGTEESGLLLKTNEVQVQQPRHMSLFSMPALKDVFGNGRKRTVQHMDDGHEEEFESGKTEVQNRQYYDYECVNGDMISNEVDVDTEEDLLPDDDEGAKDTRQKLMRSPFSTITKTAEELLASEAIDIDSRGMTSVAEVLDLVEKFEYSKIQRDLKDFQLARRKLVVCTTKLSTTPCFNILHE